MNQEQAIAKAKELNIGIKFVAMDETGDWYGYSNRPEYDGSIWLGSKPTLLGQLVRKSASGSLHEVTYV